MVQAKEQLYLNMTTETTLKKNIVNMMAMLKDFDDDPTVEP